MSVAAVGSIEEARRNRAIGQMNILRLQPVKQLPMTLLFLWMSGNDVSIFTITFLGMALMNPLSALFTINKTFEPFAADAAKDSQVKAFMSQSKLMYAGCCLVALWVALLKLYWMSLLPLYMIDWMSSKPIMNTEKIYGAAVY